MDIRGTVCEAVDGTGVAYDKDLLITTLKLQFQQYGGNFLTNLRHC